MHTSNLRVISGLYRGTNLRSPALNSSHPMGAREKLALFNMVVVNDKVVLDAYAGSGALGIEALSRGAQKVAFVESDRRVVAVLCENLQTLPLHQDVAQVFDEKVAKFALRPELTQSFDVIFADPPYDNFVQHPDVVLVDLTNLAKLLRTSGILALSSPVELGELEISGLRRSSSHTYARARISVYYRE